MVDITLHPGFSASGAYLDDFAFSALIDRVLNGPLKKKAGGGAVTWTDKRTDAEVKLFKNGGKVDKIEVKAELLYGPDAGDVTKVMTLDFSGKDAPKFKATIKAFDKFHKTGDADLPKDFSQPVSVKDRDTWKVGDRDASNGVAGTPGRDDFDMGGGDDQVYATRGKDKVDGGAGQDLVDYGYTFGYSGGGGGISAKGKGQAFTVKKPDGSKDALKNVEALSGTGGDDKMTAAKLKSAVTLRGGDGDDELTGGRKDDVLVGGPGGDKLRGGGGDDILIADEPYAYSTGGDIDRLRGDGGADLFVIGMGQSYSGETHKTIIQDFKNGQDFIGLVGMDYDELSFAKAGKDTEIAYMGEVIAVAQKTAPRAFDREDFHQDIESTLLYEYY